MTQQIQIGARLSPATTGTAIGYRIDTLAGVEHVAFTTSGVTELDVAGAWHVADPVTVPDAGCVVYWGTSGSDLLAESYGPSADVATLAALTTIDTVVDAILVDTAEIGAAGAGLTALATQASVDAIDNYIDTEIAAIKAVTDALPDAGALTTITNNVAAILDDTGTAGVTMSASTLNAIADALLSRSVSNVEDTASTHSLAEIILAMLESSAPSTTWTIYKTNGSTTFNTRTLTTDATALPVTRVA